MNQKQQQLEALCQAALDAYDSGARLTDSEAIYFANSVRVLDIPICYSILKTATERNTLQQGEIV
jgi:hypothetical protein